MSVGLRDWRTIDPGAYGTAVRGKCVTPLVVFDAETVELVIALESLSPYVIGHGRSLAEPSCRLRGILFVNKDNHPHAHGAGLTEQRRAVNPAGSAFFIAILEVWDSVGEPTHFGGDAARPVGKGAAERVTNAGVAADAVQEAGLEDSWDSERGRSEKDAERGCWSDDEVLECCQHVRVH